MEDFVQTIDVCESSMAFLAMTTAVIAVLADAGPSCTTTAALDAELSVLTADLGSTAPTCTMSCTKAEIGATFTEVARWVYVPDPQPADFTVPVCDLASSSPDGPVGTITISDDGTSFHVLNGGASFTCISVSYGTVEMMCDGHVAIPLRC